MLYGIKGSLNVIRCTRAGPIENRVLLTNSMPSPSLSRPMKVSRGALTCSGHGSWDHKKIFCVSAVVSERFFSPAWGKNKKIAEQRAAESNLERVRLQSDQFQQRIVELDGISRDFQGSSNTGTFTAHRY